MGERGDSCERPRDQFLTVVSHELRAPLTSIVSFSELLRGEADNLSEEGRHFLDIIERNAARILWLVGGRQDAYDDGVVAVNFVSREVAVHGTPVTLTPTEYRLLAALVRHKDQVLTQSRLLEYAWSDPFGLGPDRVKYVIMRLRRKLGQRGGLSIEAVRGFGYRYRAPGNRKALVSKRGGAPASADE